MDRELIDRVWKYCLPKEFKEEVKETYREYTEKIATTSEPEYRIVGYIAAQTELELLFGKHNLTSDAEGEEILTCEKSKIIEEYKAAQKDQHSNDSIRFIVGRNVSAALVNIFPEITKEVEG